MNTISIPRTNYFKKQVLDHDTVAELLSSHSSMERDLNQIANLVLSLSDSPVSLLDQMTTWAISFKKQNP